MSAAARLLWASRRRLRWVVAGLLLGCAAAVQATPPVLTLAATDIAFAAPALIAESEGWFAAEGLNLKIVHCVIGWICLKQLLDGQVHLAIVADTPIVFASFARKDFAIVASLGSSGREMRMVVRTDRGIATAADLKGRRIGTHKGTSGHDFTETFLRFNGIDPADVTLVALGRCEALRGSLELLRLPPAAGPPLISSLEAQSRSALREALVPADARLPDYLDFIRSGPLRRVDARSVRPLE